MAALVVNKLYHACAPNIGKCLKYLKRTEILSSYSTSIRKRSLVSNVIRAYTCYGIPKIQKYNSLFTTHNCKNLSSGVEENFQGVCHQLRETLFMDLDKNLTSDQIDDYLDIVSDVIKKRSNDDITIDTNRISPAELYYLASKIFSIQIARPEAAVLAAQLFKYAALQGHSDARYTYGQLLIRATGGIQPDPVEAASIFTGLAEEGHPYAQFALAGMHYTGYGVEQDFEKCYTLYHIAAENGIMQGLNSIGKLYLNGQGVEKNEIKAIEYFKKGEEAGDVHAYMSLGHCYSHGKGEEIDFKKAFECHSKAAELNYPPALYNVGTQYFMGKGVDPDILKAADYFERASELGFVLADINLGNMYYEGLGVEKNWEKAKELYRKAAPMHKQAQVLLDGIEKEEKELSEKNSS